MVGDFNVVRYPSEKSNGGRVSESMREFNSFIKGCDLVDLLSNGKFSWSNGQEGVVSCKLDRFLLSRSWVESFPNPRQALGPRFTYDHWPRCLNSGRFKWGPTSFRFENKWLYHPKFKPSLLSWWDCDVASNWEGLGSFEGLKPFYLLGYQKRKMEIAERLRVLDRLEEDGPVCPFEGGKVSFEEGFDYHSSKG